MHKTKWPLILKWKYGAYRAVFKVGHGKPNLNSYPKKIAQGGFDPPALSR